MAQLNGELLLERFNQLVYTTLGESESPSFTTGPWNEWEGWKKSVHDQAVKELHPIEWSGKEDERIVEDVKNALSMSVKETMDLSSGLLSIRNLEAAVEVIAEHQDITPLFYDLFTTPTNEKIDEEIFENLSSLFIPKRKKYPSVHAYPVISYLFFLKNESEYVSVRPKQYRDSLLKLGVEDRDLPSNCSWSGYRRLNDIMREIQCFLKTQLHDESISLLDAQSFFWMMHRVSGGGNHA